MWTGVLDHDGEPSPLTSRRPLVLGGRSVPIKPKDWSRGSYLGGQSSLLICNPVTQEFMYLPPFVRTMSLNAKAACIRFVGFAELEPPPLPPSPSPPPPEPSEEKLDAPLARHLDVGVEAVVQRASRRGTILEKQLLRKMSIPGNAAAMGRRTSRQANLDHELKELGAGVALHPSSQQSLSVHSSDTVQVPVVGEEIMEGPFQRLWRLYFECFGRVPEITPPPTRHYVVVVMGCKQERKFDEYQENQLVCCVYKSKEQGRWSYTRPIPCPAKTMPDDVGRTSLAMVTSLANEEWMAVCFGALALGNIKEVMDNEDRKYRVPRKNDKTCVDLSENPAIFFVSVVPEDNVAIVFPFTPAGYTEKELACPVVLQPFGVKSPEIVVAITRKPYWADRLIIFQIEFTHNPITENPVPTGRFLWISETPPCVYHHLFFTEKHANKPFESSAGNGMICIKSTDGQRLGLYDMYTARWWIEDFHQFRPCRRKEKPFHLMDVSSWEPNFRQRVQYASKDTDGRTDPEPADVDGAEATL